MYNALIQPDVPIDKNSNAKLWKLKITLSIKVVEWYLRKGLIITKDNLVKRNWYGSKKCVLYHQDDKKACILPIPFCQIYMVTHPIIFDLLSAM
jgi:hypothetical protein